MNEGESIVKTRWKTIAAVALVLSLLAAACSSDDDVGGTEVGIEQSHISEDEVVSDSEPTAGVVPTSNTGFIPGAIVSTECTDMHPIGGTISIGLFGEMNGWDPTTVEDGPELGEIQLMAIYDSLFYLDLTTSELLPALAESITTEDNQTFILTLRNDVNFTDGTPLNADAFIWNVEHYRTASGSRAADEAEIIAEINKIDELTVEIVAVNSNAALPLSFAGRLGKMMSPTTYEAGRDLETGLNSEINTNPVGIGAGAFLFESWIPGDEAVVVRNPDYYRAPCPYLDSVIFRPIVDASQRQKSYQAGGLDIFYSRDAVILSQERDAGSNIATYVDNHASHWLLNNSREPFNIRACRRAVAHGVDYETLNEIVHDGLSTVNRSIMSPGSPWVDPEAKIPAYDLDAARDALVECEAELGGPLEFSTFCYSETVNRKTVETLIAMWDAIGITAIANCVSVGEMASEVFAGEAIANPWSVAVGDPDDLYFSYYGDSSTDGVCGSNVSAGNYGKACYPEFDEALTQGRKGLTFAQRYEAYSRFQHKWAEEVPHILTFKPERGYVWSDKVSGMMQTSNFVAMLQFVAKG
ncbi:MAG: ABC transporter substrate-binding protein [Acidimicrobiia bacterium]|nr:ABC transporter substrate-binding protein [Acidimicrobiia bacterium]MYC57633.1 ABC transporter substrate-binding protein [Acidimicrobiia bacterium]MYI30714.1 ABC transporter substrate-binding protein [Acidimicrobiia bacterium]